MCDIRISRTTSCSPSVCLLGALSSLIAVSRLAESEALRQSASQDAEWAQENTDSMERYLAIRRCESQIGEGGRIGQTPWRDVRADLIGRWSQYVQDFPKSRLCIHAYFRLGSLYSTAAGLDQETDFPKAREYFRRAFEFDPVLLSTETILARTHFYGLYTDDAARTTYQIQLYRWLRTTMPELLVDIQPRMNRFGYYEPEFPEVYGSSEGVIRGGDVGTVSRTFLKDFAAMLQATTERNWVSVAASPDPNIGWMLLERVGDLLPVDVQGKIIEATGRRASPDASRRAAPEDEAVFQDAEMLRTVLGNEFASKLPEPDVLVPDAALWETDAGTIRAKVDTRLWLRRILRKEWWPRTDRPADYAAVRSMSGYDSVYRFWQAGDTAFVLQSTAGWVQLSLRPGAKSDKDPSMTRQEVEQRLVWIARRYIEDPHKVLRDAKFDLASRPYGYEARLRMEGDVARRLDRADRDHQFEWLRGMVARTNGTSFVFGFGPKTDADGKIRQDRKDWFGKANAQPPRAATTQAEPGHGAATDKWGE
jgi:hypothetical protein